ncbi:MAG: tRNA-dihydrouridine(20/20a) synthase [Alphaproteobacteria bacterium MarineAlpha9_Bin4]|nr:tRNA dihydrouridine(20/20a) synthase DusA [Pelagibacterales bacterium]PPR26997.1 MAG: tRNA-dihydrouridine(20/20a) synthase [Alphaproteobacteria bacterium MarineAlpha9_Bin4]|tara:strand:+ start:1109 stop:2068 length:960 start_codon:yes stop_codon:yes gene_type:complete
MVVSDMFYCVAPMMGKTDSFFCYLLNLVNKKTLVYTEMMHAESIIRTNILENYNILNNLSNVAIQIAGSDPRRLALAAKKAENYGFNEININCGCPSKRVVSGSFGINLLLNPSLVRECVEEIKNKVSKQVSIKTRIGVDSQTSDNVLDYFLIELNKEYINKYIIHARIAIRGKLNTKDNLSVPSLNYERVFRLKEKFKGNKIIINGGFKNTDYNKEVFKNIDGIMIGREAYKNPWMFNKNINSNDIDKKKKIIYLYLSFLKNNFQKHLFNKNSLLHIQNIFNGYKGAKNWRQKVAIAIQNKDLNDLLKFIDCDNINRI